MFGASFLPDDFAGVVRLFPLPDLVMFPHVVQPLRVFEPRYVAMMEDALRGDRLIGMALLQPGWEADYDGQPPIYSTVCVGRVISHSRQNDGCYNLLLAGLTRGRLRGEQPLEGPFRRAEIDVLLDQEISASDASPAACRDELLEAFQRLNPQGLASEPSIQQMLKEQIPLGMLTDVLAFAAPLRLADKQRLLDEPSVFRRVQRLLEGLRQLTGSASFRYPFPFRPTSVPIETRSRIRARLELERVETDGESTSVKPLPWSHPQPAAD